MNTEQHCCGEMQAALKTIMHQYDQINVIQGHFIQALYHTLSEIYHSVIKK